MPFDGAQFYAPPVRTRKPWYRPLRALISLPEQEAPVLWVAAPAAPEIGVIQLLETARRMIEDPLTWLQGSYVRVGGRHCAVGALRAAARALNASSKLPRAHAFLLEVARRRGFTKIEQMNDRSTHCGVLAAFDEAIAAARSRALVTP
jgi:hypothetical protein